jgi:phenylpropionate dioxygenase-like ring-hydroxylating dioxygenase large terminal subunit
MIRSCTNSKKERVFTRTWSFVGHESEIPEPGDYALRYIGDDPFIFARDEHREVRVLFNACRHRGTQVCRVERGNTSHFRCPYHGWTFKNTGEFVGMPAMKDTSQGMDKSQWGLIPAPQVTSYCGLVFACLDEDAPPFEEYLDDARYYFDLFFRLNDLEVVGAPHRWVMNANWKAGAENFGGDDYHLLFLHRSMFDVGAIQIPFSANILGHHILPGNGHTFVSSIAENPDEMAFWGMPREITERYDPSRLPDELQFNLAQRSRVGLGTIFPNTSFLTLPLTGNPAKQEPTWFAVIRQWQPKGPAKMEIWNWVLVPKDASPEFREASYRACMGTFGSSGVFEQDDSDPWTSMARSAGTAFARKQKFLMNYQMGHTIGTARFMTDWTGPGYVSNHRYEEGVHRVIYERWLDFMESPRAYPAPRKGSPLPADRFITSNGPNGGEPTAATPAVGSLLATSRTRVNGSRRRSPGPTTGGRRRTT